MLLLRHHSQFINAHRIDSMELQNNHYIQITAEKSLGDEIDVMR